MKSVPLALAGLALLLAVAACGTGTPPVATPPVSSPTSAALPSDTPTPTLEPSATFTPSPSATPVAPADTLNPLIALTPGIAQTLTAVYSTPGVAETQTAQSAMLEATQAVLMNGLSGTLLSQCPNPSDPPKQTWVNVPVMPQATAGQMVVTLIGAYYCFRAPVSGADVETFYKTQLVAPNWTMQSDLNGNMTFIGISPTGFSFLTIGYGTSQKGDLIVVLNASRPIAIPTPKK